MSRANDFDAIAAWTRLLIFDTFAIRSELRGGRGLPARPGSRRGARGPRPGATAARSRPPRHRREACQHPARPHRRHEGEGYIIVRHPEKVVRDAGADRGDGAGRVGVVMPSVARIARGEAAYSPPLALSSALTPSAPAPPLRNRRGGFPVAFADQTKVFTVGPEVDVRIRGVDLDRFALEVERVPGVHHGAN